MDHNCILYWKTDALQDLSSIKQVSALRACPTSSGSCKLYRAYTFCYTWLPCLQSQINMGLWFMRTEASANLSQKC